MSVARLPAVQDPIGRLARRLPATDAARPEAQPPVFRLLGGAARGGPTHRAVARVPDQTAVLQLQRAVGHRAVRRLLRPPSSGPGIQRCGATPCTCPAEQKVRHALEASPEASEAVSAVAALPAGRREALAQRLADPRRDPALMKRLAEPERGLTLLRRLARPEPAARRAVQRRAVQRGWFDDEETVASKDSGSPATDGLWSGEGGGAIDWPTEQAGGAADWAGEQAGGAADWVSERGGVRQGWAGGEASGGQEWSSQPSGPPSAGLLDLPDGSAASASFFPEQREPGEEFGDCFKRGISGPGSAIGGHMAGIIGGVCAFAAPKGPAGIAVCLATVLGIPVTVAATIVARCWTPTVSAQKSQRPAAPGGDPAPMLPQDEEPGIDDPAPMGPPSLFDESDFGQ